MISSGVSLLHARHWRDGKLDEDPALPIPSEAVVEVIEKLGVSPSDGATIVRCLLKLVFRLSEGTVSRGGRGIMSSSALRVTGVGDGVGEGDLGVTSI